MRTIAGMRPDVASGPDDISRELMISSQEISLVPTHTARLPDVGLLLWTREVVSLVFSLI